MVATPSGENREHLCIHDHDEALFRDQPITVIFQIEVVLLIILRVYIHLI